MKSPGHRVAHNNPAEWKSGWTIIEYESGISLLTSATRLRQIFTALSCNFIGVCIL